MTVDCWWNGRDRVVRRLVGFTLVGRTTALRGDPLAASPSAAYGA
jgi:hypothetical protein